MPLGYGRRVKRYLSAALYFHEARLFVRDDLRTLVDFTLGEAVEATVEGTIPPVLLLSHLN